MVYCVAVWWVVEKAVNWAVMKASSTVGMSVDKMVAMTVVYWAVEKAANWVV